MSPSVLGNVATSFRLTRAQTDVVGSTVPSGYSFTAIETCNFTPVQGNGGSSLNIQT
ncbi:MAG: hypothetical protein ACREFO_16130 [Acetobacteraceae bacterium]